MKKLKTIKIQERTWRELSLLKFSTNLRTHDAVVALLIAEHNGERKWIKKQ